MCSTVSESRGRRLGGRAGLAGLGAEGCGAVSRASD